MMILKLRRPLLFNFKPGQYAFLRLQDVDIHWHPFSIASGPNESELEFYIEVFKDDSWTGILWNVLKKDKASMNSDLSDLTIDFDLMGPYGTSLGKTEDFSNVLAVGAGTGMLIRYRFLSHRLECEICNLTQSSPSIPLPPRHRPNHESFQATREQSHETRSQSASQGDAGTQSTCSAN